MDFKRRIKKIEENLKSKKDDIAICFVDNRKDEMSISPLDFIGTISEGESKIKELEGKFRYVIIFNMPRKNPKL